MATKKVTTVEQYLGAQPPPARTVLNRVLATIRKALPKAREVVSYQIPAFAIDGRCVVYLGGWKQHYSLYPVTEAVLGAFERELREHDVEKGTVRFAYAKPVPTGLIAGIARVRAAEEQAWQAARATKRPARAKKPAAPKRKRSAEKPAAPKRPWKKPGGKLAVPERKRSAKRR